MDSTLLHTESNLRKLMTLYKLGNFLLAFIHLIDRSIDRFDVCFLGGKFNIIVKLRCGGLVSGDEENPNS